MLFKRRERASLWEQTRVALWPRRSWSRSARYVLLRIWRLGDSAHRVALGVAAGVFVACTPFLGLQVTLAVLIALMLGGSVLAAALGTFFANPLTIPVVWVADYKIGNWLLGETGEFQSGALRSGFSGLFDAAAKQSTGDAILALDMLWPVLKPMALGGCVVGAVFGALSYVMVRRAMGVSRARRLARIADARLRAEARRSAVRPEIGAGFVLPRPVLVIAG